jgi:hypothetical protein
VKKYCPIPEVTQIKSLKDIADAIAEIFATYGATKQGYSILNKEATFRIRLAQEGILEFQINMPDLSDWLFYEEEPGELKEGAEALGEDYEPMRCFPSDLQMAWQRLLLYRAARLLSVLRAHSRRVEQGELSFQQALPLNRRFYFGGHCGLEAKNDPVPEIAVSDSLPF